MYFLTLLFLLQEYFLLVHVVNTDIYILYSSIYISWIDTFGTISLDTCDGESILEMDIFLFIWWCSKFSLLYTTHTGEDVEHRCMGSFTAFYFMIALLIIMIACMPINSLSLVYLSLICLGYIYWIVATTLVEG